MAEKNGRTLTDTFKKVVNDLSWTEREIFNDATDVKLKIDRERRIAEVSCALPRVYEKQEIYALEAKIKMAYELSHVKILPHYPSELFTLEYMSEIFTEVARLGIVANGFFGKFTSKLEDGVIKVFIPLTGGAIALMDLARTAGVAEGILASEFGLALEASLVRRGASAKNERLRAIVGV